MTEEMDLRQWAIGTAVDLGVALPDLFAEADKLVDYVMGLSTAGRDDA